MSKTFGGKLFARNVALRLCSGQEFFEMQWQCADRVMILCYSFGVLFKADLTLKVQVISAGLARLFLAGKVGVLPGIFGVVSKTFCSEALFPKCSFSRNGAGMC